MPRWRVAFPSCGPELDAEGAAYALTHRLDCVPVYVPLKTVGRFVSTRNDVAACVVDLPDDGCDH